MPTYGEAKIRDIAESILPSTARRRAREDRQAIHRAERRRVRQQYGDEDILGNERQVRRDINAMKWERRSSDKLGPVMRWAKATTAAIEDPVERYMFVKTLMPDNLIGRHALSHIDDIDGIEPPGRNPYLYSFGRGRPRPERDYRAALLRVVEDCRHAELNAAMRACHRQPVARSITHKDHLPDGTVHRWYEHEYGHVVRYLKNSKGWYTPRQAITVPCTCGPRIFKGLHDIDDFLADLYRQTMRQTDWQEYVSHHPERKKALDAFLDKHYPLA